MKYQILGSKLNFKTKKKKKKKKKKKTKKKKKNPPPRLYQSLFAAFEEDN
jgi:hypothetical protein